jgi:hypothetical protein
MQKSAEQNDELLLHSALGLPSLLSLFVAGVLTATAAELAEFQTLCRGLLVLRRDVVAAFAFRALEHNIIARHNSPSPKLKSSSRPAKSTQ